MNLYIRADSDSNIGTGHIMRCIALAQAWQDQGGEVTFISHCESEALKKRIQREGFSFISLDHVCPDSSDLMNTLTFLKSKSADHKNWVILDGYHFTPEYQKAIRDGGGRLLVIDDMNHLPHYYVDILLNQNIHAPNLKYRCDADTTLLLGTSYVLLRREFLKYRGFKHQIPDLARNILVTLGGADPDNVTLNVINAVKFLDEPNIMIRVIVGSANPHQEKLSKALASTNFEAELLTNPPNIPELMAWADMAISAGGITCWELAFMGVPIIALIIADNQQAVAEGIRKKGLAVNLGWWKSLDMKTMSQVIKKLIHSKDRRSSMVQKGQALINITGKNCLYEKLFATSISIKPAKDYDCELIWNWANDPEVRNSAFCSDMISLEDHKKWFYSKINNSKCYQFVGYNTIGQPIGQIRFDEVSEREYDIDISIDKAFRARGYGSELIKYALRELINYTKVDVIHSHVKFSNMPSKYLFLKAGFIRVEDTIIKDTECLHFIWKGNDG